MKDFIREVAFPLVICAVILITAVFGCVYLAHLMFSEDPPTPTQQTIEENKKISEAQTILLSRCIERLGWCQDICDYEAEAARREK